MAQPTDPTFGAGFPAAEFRNAITQTMIMGQPNAVVDKATFYFEGKADYSVTDPSGVPYDLTATVVSDTGLRDPVVEVCSVAYDDRSSSGTRLGQFDNPRAVVTMLDEQYGNVVGATAVKLGGDMYDIRYITVGGLFDVDVFEINCEARSES